MSTLGSAAVAVLLAAGAPSDADTPTDAPSAWNDFLPWLLLGVGVFALLLLGAVGVKWRGKRSSQAPASVGPAPVEPPPVLRRPDGPRDIAVLTFDGIPGAERAFARAREDVVQAPWLAEVAFVEHHHRDRIVVHGTFAGRYLDVEHVGGRLLEEIEADVPVGSSALVVFAPPDEVDAALDTFHDSGARVTRHRVSAADAAAFEASVAQAPPAATTHP